MSLGHFRLPLFVLYFTDRHRSISLHRQAKCCPDLQQGGGDVFFIFLLFLFIHFIHIFIVAFSFHIKVKIKESVTPLKKQFPLDGFGVAPIFPSFSLIILFTFTFFKYFPFLFHCHRRFCLLFTIFIFSFTCFLQIYHFTFNIFRCFCQQPQCLFLFFSPHLSSFKQSLR